MENGLEVAAKALKHYSIDADTITFVGQSAGSIFKVEDVQKNMYSLRLHLSKSETMESFWTQTEMINSEMIWLQALPVQSDLVIPVPYKTSNGKWTAEVDGVNCTLLGWVEGEQKSFISHSEDAGLVGQMIGKLHQQASLWAAPDNFTRPVFDENRISHSFNKIYELSETGQLAKEDAELLIAAGQRAITMMETIERTQHSWGMIHADLIPSNYVFHNLECRPIDFGACGFGYFLFDLGWAFSYIHPTFRLKMLESYSNYFRLPENHVELLEGFFVAAQLETMNFWLGLPDALEWLPSHMNKLATREFKHYVRKEPFLFKGTPYWE